MKLNSLAMALVISLLVVGCGGGGGGGSSGNAGGGPTTGGPTTGGPTTGSPTTNTPVVAGVASYAGNRADYSIVRTSTGFTVTDKRNNSVATVTGATTIRFTDVRINAGIGDKAVAFGAANLKSLIELYMALMNRVPEAESLGIWIDRLQAGQTMAQLADALHAEAALAPQVSGFSAATTNTDYVTTIYKNVFGLYGATAPATPDVDAWVARIDKGGDRTRGTLVVAMLESARAGTGALGAATVIQLLDNKADVGDYVAARQGITYNVAEESVTRTKTIAEAVSSTDTTAAMALLGFSDSSFNLKLAGKQ